MNKNLFFVVLLIFLCFFSCRTQNVENNFYEFNSLSNQKFLELVNQKNNIKSYEEFQIWVKEIQELFIINDRFDYLIQFFDEIAAQEEKEDFKAYLYFTISDIYWQAGNNNISIFYMLKVNEESYFLDYNYKPIGYYIAKRIINTESPAELKIKMYNILINDFSEIVDITYILYELADLYKNELDINNAVKTMQKLVRYSRGSNDLVDIEEVKKEIKYYNSKKTWVYQDLETLINKIKEAIVKKDQKLLYSYISKNDFRIKIFQKVQTNLWDIDEIQITRRWNDKIVFSNELEEFSCEKEAYLKTKNWNFSNLRTWYFYFRRVNYPYDNKVDGGWEWAGIYFGYPFSIMDK